jgi:hypothetical protein
VMSAFAQRSDAKQTFKHACLFRDAAAAQ